MFVKNDHRPEILVFHVLRIRSITAAETQWNQLMPMRITKKDPVIRRQQYCQLYILLKYTVFEH